jgi:hypothetical protein
MNNEKYNKIIDEAYNNYKNEINRRLCIPLLETTERDNIIQGDIYESTSLNDISRIWTKEEFVNKIKTDKKFSERWGLKIEEHELSEERRYNIWFNNNYETGMERFFNPEDLPDYDNPYYEPTPKKLIIVNYMDEKIEGYE